MTLVYNADSASARTHLAGVIHDLLAEMKFELLRTEGGQEIWDFKTSNPRFSIQVHTGICNDIVQSVFNNQLQIFVVYRNVKIMEDKVKAAGYYHMIEILLKQRIRRIYMRINKLKKCPRCKAPLIVDKEDKEKYTCADDCLGLGDNNEQDIHN